MGKDGAKSRGCCGLLCFLGTLLVMIIVVMLVLIFTVFKVKDPTMILNKISLGTNNVGSQIIQSGFNTSMIADVSVKNPNSGTFKFSNTTTSIFYNGVMVGNGYGPPGQARSQRTLRMKVTVAIDIASLLTAPNLTSDIASGLLTMDSYTRVPGKVKVLVIVKKHVVVEMNCTVSFNITSQEIQDQRCKNHVDL